MSKLLARAKAKRFSANNSYNYMSLDDAYIDETCFNLQMAIELSLKYLVEINGEDYIENHDIRAQLNKLRNMNKYVPCEDKLRQMASTINSWAVDSRYNDNFVALIDDIDEAKIIVDELIEYCDKQVVEID